MSTHYAADANLQRPAPRWSERHGDSLPPTGREQRKQEPIPLHPSHHGGSPRRSFWDEVRAGLDRRLVHWVLAYLAGAWLVLQLMDVLTEIWAWPTSLQRAVCLTLGMGIFPATVVAWFHGEQGRQEVTVLEAVLVTALLFVCGAVVWAVCFGPV